MAANNAAHKVATSPSHKTLPPFGMKDKLGYMFGDFGNDFTFILASMFLLKFYTDVMGVSAGAVGTVMMVSRFVDAFTDVTMGQIVDRSKPTKDGKFKPWIRRMCIPVAAGSFLMYLSPLASMSYGVKVGWLAFSYILYGSFLYTSINIPYGSMASAISGEAKDRAELSTWRSIGATLASTVIGAGVPMLAFVANEQGNVALSGPRVMMISAVFSVGAVICYMLCFSLSTERVEVPANNQKLDLGAMLKSILTNRSLLGIIVTAIIFLLTSMSLSGLVGYVYPNYYGAPSAQSTATMANSVVALVILAPLMPKLAAKMGKKEISVFGCLAGAIASFACYFLKPSSAMVYVVFSLLVMAFGQGFFNMIIWAMITDVIDDAEIKNGIREDGTIYSIYSFARKMGQAFSSGLVGAILSGIGYSEATAFDPAVTQKIFDMSCLVPGIGFLATAVALWFLYPLSKKRVDENIAKLRSKHAH